MSIEFKKLGRFNYTVYDITDEEDLLTHTKGGRKLQRMRVFAYGNGYGTSLVKIANIFEYLGGDNVVDREVQVLDTMGAQEHSMKLQIMANDVFGLLSKEDAIIFFTNLVQVLKDKEDEISDWIMNTESVIMLGTDVTGNLVPMTSIKKEFSMGMKSIPLAENRKVLFKFLEGNSDTFAKGFVVFCKRAGIVDLFYFDNTKRLG